MPDRSSTSFERFGAVAGLVSVALLVALVMFLPSLPAPDRTMGQIAGKAGSNSTGLLLGAYLGALMSGTLVVFGTAIVARLRRTGDADEGWWLLALAGMIASSVGIAGNALDVMFVRAVGHRTPHDALWVGYGGGHWVTVLMGIPLAIFVFGAAMGVREAATLPRWLARLGIGAAAMLLAGAASVVGDEVDGGVLGLALLIGYLGFIVWVAGASVSILRRERTPAPALAVD